MGNFKELIIPQLNVNDTRVTISDIRKQNLEYIEKDEMLYCIETSKATEDYYPKYSGYVVMFVEDFDELEVGKSAGMIFKDMEDAKMKLAEIETLKAEREKLNTVNASKKAIAFATERGVDITQIKKDGIIKTKDVEEWINMHH